MADYIVFWGSVIFAVLFEGFIWVYLMMELLYTKINRRHLIINTGIEVVFGMAYMILEDTGLLPDFLQGNFELYLLLTLMHLLFFTLVAKKSFFKVFSAIMVSLAFYGNFSDMVMGLVRNAGTYVIETYNMSNISLYMIISAELLNLLVLVVLVKIFRRFHVRSLLDQMFKKLLSGFICLVVCVLLRMAYYIFWFVNPAIQSLNYNQVFTTTSSISFNGIFIFITLIIILFFSIYESNQAKIKAQQAIILQQQNYVQSLEEMQRQMRAFRHDLQNLMSGMYLQVSEGENEQVQEFLKRSINYFDEHLGNEIKLMGFLSNVNNMEMKSLLLVKLIQAQQQNLECNIEVVRPIEEIGMEAEDFLRCFGILIDNAFEEVKKAVKGRVNIILLNEKNELNVVVENTVTDSPEIGMISKKGYSTKGTGRGLGLHIYQEILKKYNNVIPKTVCTGVNFRQEIKIRRK